MRYVLFDLGDTLEHQDELLPGAREALTAITALHDTDDQPPKLGLISDFTMPTTPSDLPEIEGEYRQIIRNLGIDGFFQPFEKAVTLSSQVGAFKPDRKVFRAALDKFDLAARFRDAIFVTENKAH